MTTASNPLAVALDTSDLAVLRRLARALGPVAGVLKIGLEAFMAHGPAAIAPAAAHAPVFLDAKLHDIPNTVAGAAAAAAAHHGVALLTVHASGGPAMIEAAARAAPDVAILAVTVLTSLDDETLADLGQPPASEQVPALARVAAAAGAGGIVCAPTEAALVRDAVGPDLLVVTPGVRPAGAAHGDQARVATPAEAIRAGADLVVVGRPVTHADDPAAAAAAILMELGAAPSSPAR